MFLQGYEQQALDTPFYHLFGSLRSYVNLSFFLAGILLCILAYWSLSAFVRCALTESSSLLTGPSLLPYGYGNSW